MKLIRYRFENQIHTGVVTADGIAPVADDLLSIIQSGKLPAVPAGAATVAFDQVTPLLPYDVPPKIWCIGLNYKTHAEDIDAVQPEEPGSFMKPASCMFQPGGSCKARRAIQE